MFSSFALRRWSVSVIGLVLCLCVVGQGRVGLPQGGGKGGTPLARMGYCLLFDNDTHCPVWVAWELTAEHASGTEKRSNRFKEDTTPGVTSARLADYVRSGYDRGHMCPAADCAWDAVAMRESFLLSNICPQRPHLNQQTWRKLEERCRRRARTDGTLYIVCGPIYEGDAERLGTTGVAIPTAFFKVVYTESNGQPRAAGFLFSNADAPDDEEHIVTVDSVEALTGLDFFPDLPDTVERAVESFVLKAFWQ